MINAVGLQNPGVDKVISEELPKLKKVFHKKVMANVSGFSVEDYAYTCAKLDSEEQIGWLEVNVSCPNVHDLLPILQTDIMLSQQDRILIIDANTIRIRRRNALMSIPCIPEI